MIKYISAFTKKRKIIKVITIKEKKKDILILFLMTTTISKQCETKRNQTIETVVEGKNVIILTSIDGCVDFFEPRVPLEIGREQKHERIVRAAVEAKI